ncbi:DUF1104 domain-containing protein [Helicobacter cetorum]|uniref:DUF1104 domain-containing protein n=1 Tax=Helicobacter cetorum TaxID=138563 RepID=UPI000CF0DB18|nr:DUF1104 domain-containing protein [Helicobacter cetorum]
MVKKCVLAFSLATLMLAPLGAMDFSKKSDLELAKMAGVVAPKDIVDYKKELRKRLKDMSQEKRAKFHKQLHEYAIKNTDDMSVEEFEAHKKAVQEELSKHNMKDLDKELGLKSCDCGKKKDKKKNELGAKSCDCNKKHAHEHSKGKEHKEHEKHQQHKKEEKADKK